LLDLIREHPGVPTSQDAVRFTASIGVAVTLPFEQPQEWLGRADRALYEAKTGGRDRFATCHGPSAASADHAQAA
jgi:PleD family two-component response regulator